MHIRFTGRSKNTGHNVTKIVPDHIIGLVCTYEDNKKIYWAEVYYARDDRYYELTKKEFDRIARLIEKIK